MLQPELHISLSVMVASFNYMIYEEVGFHFKASSHAFLCKLVYVEPATSLTVKWTGYIFGNFKVKFI